MGTILFQFWRSNLAIVTTIIVHTSLLVLLRRHEFLDNVYKFESLIKAYVMFNVNLKIISNN